MPIYKLGSTKFRACDTGCAMAFREDRRRGMNYGLHKKADGTPYMHREAYSIGENVCAYCGTSVVTKAKPFTPAELEIIDRAAHAVWSDIAYDAIISIAEAKGKKGKHRESYTMSRPEVVELVCDASRLEMHLRDNGYKELAEKVSNTHITPIVLKMFNTGRYGL